MVPASSLASEQRIPAGSWEETVDFEGAHSGPILHTVMEEGSGAGDGELALSLQ